MDEVGRPREGYECVDPDVGDEIWRLDDPALAAEYRYRLETHLMICDACRLRRAADRRVAEGLAQGSLELFRRRARLRRAVIGVGGLALAAGMVMMIFLPPRARDGDRISRAFDEPSFTRPVEGEVVPGGRPILSWASIEGVSAYRIRIDEVGGDFEWQGETSGLFIKMPAETTLPLGRDYRAYLEPVPADLVAPGGASVSFRTGDALAVSVYRFVAAPRPAILIACAGLLGLCIGIFSGARRP